MSTVAKLTAAVQRLGQTYITKGKARRFACGVAALSLSAFESLNAAGRSLGFNRFTGENRIRRLVMDEALSNQLEQLLVSEALGRRSGYFYCSLDHSQFGSFCIAVLALSVRKGRSIPIWCQVNKSEAALMLPLLAALEALFKALVLAAPSLKLVLVMDRWFAADKLFKLLIQHQVYFIARTKGDKLVQLPWDPSWWREPIGDISHEELAVTYRKHRLRLVRSTFKEGMKGGEPWFLLTNLPEEITRLQILNRYKERFEIEEAFKDLKWLQRLEWQKVRTAAVIRSLLLFVFFGWWLLWRYVQPVASYQLPNKRLHLKKRLSWFRLSWEYLQRLLRTPLLPVPALQRGLEK
jgi:hypothetical protein